MAKLKQSSQSLRLNIGFSGGLNLSAAEWSIADNESPRMLNFVFNPESMLPEVRPGTTCQTAAASASSIRALYLYEKTTSTKYVVAAIGAKIYYLSGTGLNAWTEIGAIASASVVPEFLTFNSKLLIADGGTNIKTWDGTTFGTIATSPNATCLRVIKQRVAANHAGELDSVYLSAPNDETVWNTTTTAIGLKAGYGDTLKVNGMEVFGDDLVISKTGNATKKLYRLNTAEITTEYWYITQIPGNYCAQNEQAIVTAFNNVFIYNTDGMKSLKGVQEYGDIQSDQIGRKINSQFDSSSTCHFIKYIPTYNAIWFSIGSRIYTGRLEESILSCTELAFIQGQIDSLCIDGSTVYLGSNSGHLYKLDASIDTDEATPSTNTAFTSVLKSKRHNLGADDITIRQTTIRITPLVSGSLALSVIKDDGIPVTLDTVTIESEGEYLYDATDYLYDATGYLYDSGGSPSMHVNHNKVKSPSIQYQIQSTGCRFGIDSIVADILVSRGTY